MLRHYDAIGLLRPAHVDQVTGYRSYEAQQLMRLNQIVALKDLGLTLQQVRSILDDKVSAEELRGMMRLRRAGLQEQIATDTARLAQVEARLQIIEMEGAMPADDLQIKRIPAVRVAELTGTAASFEPRSIAPVIGPLYEELSGRLDRAGLTPTGPAIAYCEDSADGDGIVVHAAMPVKADPGTTTTSRSWICPRSSERRRSCTLARWTTSSRPSSPWPAGSTPMDTARPVIAVSFTSIAATTGMPG